MQVDKHTLQSPNWPNVFSLGDASSLPTSKTGAAIRKQSPVLVANLLAAMRGQPLTSRYNGYTSCPLVTSRNRMLLAEFDYDFKRTPTHPLINTHKPRTDKWQLKRYGLPALFSIHWRRRPPPGGIARATAPGTRTRDRSRAMRIWIAWCTVTWGRRGRSAEASPAVTDNLFLASRRVHDIARAMAAQGQ